MWHVSRLDSTPQCRKGLNRFRRFRALASALSLAIGKSDKIARMGSSIKAIIFDFGGVLLEWDPRNLYQRYFPDHPQAMDDFLDEIDFYDWNSQQDKGRTFADGIAELSAQFPQHAHLIQAYYDHWEDSITGAIPGTVEILHRLKRIGYPLYGLSNWSAETYPRAKAKYPFFDWFDKVILSGEVKLDTNRIPPFFG